MGAQMAMSQQKHGEAENLLRQAVSEAERELSNFDNQIATLCNNLANCLRNQGKHPEAEGFPALLALPTGCDGEEGAWVRDTLTLPGAQAKSSPPTVTLRGAANGL